MRSAAQSIDLSSLYVSRRSTFGGDNNALVPNGAASAGPQGVPPGVGEAKPDTGDAPEEAASELESTHHRQMTLGGESTEDENAPSREDQV